MHKTALLLAFVAATQMGCATSSSNMRIGTDTSYMSLRDQREAQTLVKEYREMPSGATKAGTVDASRCHRNSLQGAPSEADVLIDLKAAAYARGADGITDVKITTGSGLLLNCWSILTGTATALTVKP